MYQGLRGEFRMNEPLPLDQALGILYKTNNFKLNPKPLKPKPKGLFPTAPH